MADPFLSQSVAGIYQELQRLRSENKELRLEVTTLRLRVQDQSFTAQAASSSSSNAPRKNSTKTTNTSTGSARVRDADEDERVNTVSVSASQEMRDGQRSDAQTASPAREEQLTSPNGTRPATTIRRHSQQGTSSSPVNEELRHGRVVAEKEATKYKAELKQVTAHFEAFITEVTEREAGYKAVYGGIYHELNEARAKCAGLQRQVQELESRLATAEQQAMKAATGVRLSAEPRPIAHVSNTPLQPAKQEQQRQQQQRRRRSNTAAEDTVPTRSSSKEGESQVQKQQAASNPSVSASETATTATLDTTAKEVPVPASPFAMPPPVTVTGDKPQTALHIAKGAAALRATSYDKLTQPRRTHSQRGMEGRRGREGHELVRPTAQPRYETPRSSLFARFQQNKADSALKTDADITSTSKSANDSSTNLHSSSLAGPLASSSTTTAKTAIHFGSDPIADFLRLHESTTVAHHRSRLAAELMRHFQQRYEVLAEAVVRHFIRSVHSASSAATPSLSELWAKLEIIMGIAPESILPALTHAALSQLVQLLQGSLAAATANEGEEGEEMNVVEEEGQVGMTQSGLPSTSNITNSSVTVPSASTEQHTRQSEGDVWWSERVAKVRLVALMLRLAYLQSASHSSQCHDQGYRCNGDTLLELFITFTLGALRVWSDVVRRGTNTPSQASTSAMATLVQLWMTGVLALCGYQSSVQLFLRYYNVPEAAITSWVLPHALVCYTVQGIMRLCYMQCAAELQQRRRTTHWHVIRDAQGSSAVVVNECEGEESMTNDSPEKDEEGQREVRSDSVWDCFCDALGWSTRQMPLDRLGEAAATLAVQPTTSNNEGLRRTCLQSLRCLVLYKGFSYVHTIREYLAHCAAPHGVADAIFAELLSYAVLDLRLADSRDAQWTQSIAFLDDYLNGTSNTTISSPTSRSAQDSVNSSSSNQFLQGLVLRAILQLCASPLNETSVRVLSRAMRWVKSHTIHSNGNTTQGDAVPEIGRRLLQLIEQSS